MSQENVELLRAMLSGAPINYPIGGVCSTAKIATS
jgi:hypothetical protein